ncbi:MAG: tRNA pseudouridine(13) synthase TruD [Planctomycetota bacterium]|nr:tRNA pseudouridine(13) synthase TruD [Planctomycetota bacterium]
MRLKVEPSDFIVRELIVDEYFKERGRFQVYRVTKRKLTTLEAQMRVAELAGVAQADVGLAGLKDRQGVTTQFMSVKGGRPVFLKTPELRIESVGFASHELTSAESLGNAFEITVRRLSQADYADLVRGVAEVKAYGLPNYFGEQRFGNLRHGQGWIARDLALGKHELALKSLLAGKSDHDDARNSRFKNGIQHAWGDWRQCREIAGRFGQYISVFQHLIREGDDFAGAFRYVKSQLRLIHLYAWQSHLWNRAVAAYIEEVTPAKERFMVASPEGRLIFARGEIKIDPETKGKFRLPGTGLDDVKNPRQRDLLALALRNEGLAPHEFRIEGVSGFQLKGEDRPLVVIPQNMRVDDRGDGKIVVSFDLPRGAYATLVMARILPPKPERDRSDGPRRSFDEDDRGPRGARSKLTDRGDSRGTSAPRGARPGISPSRDERARPKSERAASPRADTRERPPRTPRPRDATAKGPPRGWGRTNERAADSVAPSANAAGPKPKAPKRPKKDKDQENRR